MRILVLSSIHPYPADDGGKADIARRLELLQEFGAELLVLSWHSQAPSGPSVEDFRSLSPRGLTFQRQVTLQHFFHPRLPYTARHLQWTAQELPSVVERVREFAPELILVEGIFSYGPLIQIFPQVTGRVPVVLRSQSVEHQFFKVLAAGARNPVHRLYYLQESWRLRPFERRTLPFFDQVFQICPEDAAFWMEQGLPQQEYLPLYYTAAARSAGPPDATKDAVYDLGYMASFISPHKVAALRWFVEQVWPRLPKSLRFAVAGSHAPPEVEQLCAAHGIRFLGFVPDLQEYLSSCRILLIPLHQTSGVLAKLLEMIDSGASVITTTVGLRGYPPEVRSFVRCADTPEEFERTIRELLDRPLDTSAFPAFAGRMFGRDRYQAFSRQLEAWAARGRTKEDL